MVGTDIKTAAVGYLLEDGAAVTWLDPETIVWVNAGMREIVNLVPKAYVVRSSITLTARACKQDLPSGTIRLMGVHRNVGTDDSAGPAVRLASRDQLDAYDRNWTKATPARYVGNVVYDTDAPKEFWCSPPPRDASKLDVALSKVPTAIEALADTLVLGDEYRNALIDYVCFRALSKNDADAQQVKAAADYYALFRQDLGLKTAADEVAKT